MSIVLYAYVLLSTLAGIITMFRSSFWVGASILGASWIVVMAVGGIKAAILWYPPQNRVGTILAAIILLGIVCWLSPKFVIGISDYVISGWAWSLLGAIAAAIGVNRKIAT